MQKLHKEVIMENIVIGTLQDRIQRTPTIESFRFALKEKVNFIPGQFLKVIFDRPNLHNSELNKYLSFSSSPTKDYIEVTKRITNSQFSQALANLKIGDELSFEAPFGNCVFDKSFEKIGFLIGGIGITPVISIIEYIMDMHLDTDIFLAYSSRVEEEIAFKTELDAWSQRNNKLKVIYLVADCEPQDKRCLFGRINKETVMAGGDASLKRVFYIYGPPAMVEAMKKICVELGCNQEKIKTERFIGY
jgi:ferredoxin-NADP reductase